MNAFLTVISVFSVVLNNALNNRVCKKDLKDDAAMNAFNTVTFAGCLVLFGLAAALSSQSVSLFTVLLGVIFGVVTALATYYKLKALACGPMHVTLLICTASMIIPTLSGVFFGEPFSLLKLLFALILLFFVYLTIGKSEGGRIDGRWFLFTVISFLLTGAIGVLQKVHQASIHKDELYGFLFAAFVCSALFSLIKTAGKKGFSALTARPLIYAILSGVCVFAMNAINLKLSGVLPSQLFFPLINGSTIVLTSLAAVVVFKEKLTTRQTAGLIGGIAALVAICLVP